MQYYRKTSHSFYDLKYHLVWITKYRKPILSGEIAKRLRAIVLSYCKELDVEILKGYVSQDHVHLFVSVPPYISVSSVMQKIKGKSAYKMRREFKTLSRQFYGRHLWASGSFEASSGNVTDAMILEYIENQNVEPPDGDILIDGETDQ